MTKLHERRALMLARREHRIARLLGIRIRKAYPDAVVTFTRAMDDYGGKGWEPDLTITWANGKTVWAIVALNRKLYYREEMFKLANGSACRIFTRGDEKI